MSNQEISGMVFTPMSFSALATVCDQSADVVKHQLTDIFSCLVEVNRKTKREVRMTF